MQATIRSAAIVMIAAAAPVAAAQSVSISQFAGNGGLFDFGNLAGEASVAGNTLTIDALTNMVGDPVGGGGGVGIANGLLNPFASVRGGGISAFILPASDSDDYDTIPSFDLAFDIRELAGNQANTLRVQLRDADGFDDGPGTGADVWNFDIADLDALGVNNATFTTVRLPLTAATLNPDVADGLTNRGDGVLNLDVFAFLFRQPPGGGFEGPFGFEIQNLRLDYVGQGGEPGELFPIDGSFVDSDGQFTFISPIDPPGGEITLTDLPDSLLIEIDGFGGVGVNPTADGDYDFRPTDKQARLRFKVLESNNVASFSFRLVDADPGGGTESHQYTIQLADIPVGVFTEVIVPLGNPNFVGTDGTVDGIENYDLTAWQIQTAFGAPLTDTLAIEITDFELIDSPGLDVFNADGTLTGPGEGVFDPSGEPGNTSSISVTDNGTTVVINIDGAAFGGQSNPSYRQLTVDGAINTDAQFAEVTLRTLPGNAANNFEIGFRDTDNNGAAQEQWVYRPQIGDLTEGEFVTLTIDLSEPSQFVSPNPGIIFGDPSDADGTPNYGYAGFIIRANPGQADPLIVEIADIRLVSGSPLADAELIDFDTDAATSNTTFISAFGAGGSDPATFGSTADNTFVTLNTQAPGGFFRDFFGQVNSDFAGLDLDDYAFRIVARQVTVPATQANTADSFRVQLDDSDDEFTPGFAGDRYEFNVPTSIFRPNLFTEAFIDIKNQGPVRAFKSGRFVLLGDGVENPNLLRFQLFTASNFDDTVLPDDPRLHIEIDSIELVRKDLIPCRIDEAGPIGTLDFFDIGARLQRADDADPDVDIAPNFTGTPDAGDIDRYLLLFEDGCPSLP